MEPAGLSTPIVLGHENAGWVHAVGADVTTAEPGDAVLVYPPYSCGLCVNCRRGLDMHCDRHQFYGLTKDGGFADYVLVDERSLDPAAGRASSRRRSRPTRTPASPRIHAVKRLLDPPHARHDVGGDRRRRCRPHRAAAPEGARRRLGDRDRHGRAPAGARAPSSAPTRCSTTLADLREATNGAGADVIMDFVATDATHAASLDALARRGLYSTVGYGGMITVPSVAMVVGETTIAGQPRRQLDRPLGAAPAPRARRRDAAHRDAPARGRERRARRSCARARSPAARCSCRRPTSRSRPGRASRRRPRRRRRS